MTYNPTLEKIKSKISTTSSQKSKETREDAITNAESHLIHSKQEDRLMEYSYLN